MNAPSRRAMFAVIAAGAFGGTLARYGLEVLVPPSPFGWPWATFTVNCLGAFALCLLLQTLAERGPDEGQRRLARLGIGTGFLGAFTTYSSLAMETVTLLHAGRAGLAAGYVLASVVGGLVCGTVGIAAAHRFRGVR